MPGALMADGWGECGGKSGKKGKIGEYVLTNAEVEMEVAGKMTVMRQSGEDDGGY